MVAPRFPYRAVALSTQTSGEPRNRLAHSRDLVPWADPYIALLIRKLQDEVRAERAQPAQDKTPQMRQTLRDELYMEAAPTGLEEPLDFEFPENADNWSGDAWPPSQPR